MGFPLIQQMSEVHGHVPYHNVQLARVHLTAVQPLQIHDVLLTVGQLINMRMAVRAVGKLICTRSAAAF